MPRVDEEFRQLMLWLEGQARERSRAFDAWMERSERESEIRHRQVMAHLEELRADSLTQRAALFRILDRPDGGGGAAPA
jgi:hypothetical protein